MRLPGCCCGWPIRAMIARSICWASPVESLGQRQQTMVVSGRRRQTALLPFKEAGACAGSGVGALVGDRVYWPTEHEIYVFDQRTAEQPKQPIELSVHVPHTKLQGTSAGSRQTPVLLATDKIIAFDQRSGVGVARKKRPETVCRRMRFHSL